MALFQEIDLTTAIGGQISSIEPGSVADEVGLQVGDELLGINDNSVEDVIDVQYYSAEEQLELLIRRGDEHLIFEAERMYDQTLGLQFTHPTFDTDIRRCNNLCEFCFVLQMAPKFRRTLYIKDDDYRYSFLFGHYVTLTNLSKHDWWRIKTMHLSPLYVSVHVTDLEQRRQYLRNKTAPDILEQLQQLQEWGIEVHTQLVITPNVNDGAIMRKSIEDLTAFWPTVQSISVVPVGLTKQHKYSMRPHTQAEAAATLTYVESLQPAYLERFGARFVYPTDEWFLVSKRPVPSKSYYDDQSLHENGLGMVRHFLDEWQGVEEEIKSWHMENDRADEYQFKSITLVTATLFSETLVETAVKFQSVTNIPINVIPIVNERLGNTITVAGLLMVKDVLAGLETAVKGDLIMLPRVMFDHPDTISLDDTTPQELANRLNQPIALADTMGDVWDALIGQSQTIYYPGTAPDSSIPLSILPDDEPNSHFS